MLTNLEDADIVGMTSETPHFAKSRHWKAMAFPIPSIWDSVESPATATGFKSIWGTPRSSEVLAEKSLIFPDSSKVGDEESDEATTVEEDVHYVPSKKYYSVKAHGDIEVSQNSAKAENFMAGPTGQPGQHTTLNTISSSELSVSTSLNALGFAIDSALVSQRSEIAYLKSELKAQRDIISDLETMIKTQTELIMSLKKSINLETNDYTHKEPEISHNAPNSSQTSKLVSDLESGTMSFKEIHMVDCIGKELKEHILPAINSLESSVERTKPVGYEAFLTSTPQNGQQQTNTSSPESLLITRSNHPSHDTHAPQEPMELFYNVTRQKEEHIPPAILMSMQRQLPRAKTQLPPCSSGTERQTREDPAKKTIYSGFNILAPDSSSSDFSEDEQENSRNLCDSDTEYVSKPKHGQNALSPELGAPVQPRNYMILKPSRATLRMKPADTLRIMKRASPDIFSITPTSKGNLKVKFKGTLPENAAEVVSQFGELQDISVWHGVIIHGIFAHSSQEDVEQCLCSLFDLKLAAPSRVIRPRSRSPDKPDIYSMVVFVKEEEKSKEMLKNGFPFQGRCLRVKAYDPEHRVRLRKTESPRAT